MSSDDDLQDSIERTRQAFRSAPEAPPLIMRRDEAHREDNAPPLTYHRDGVAPPITVGTNATPGMHPFFRGLFDALPEPGSHWSKIQRDQWLETARHIFALIYADSDPRVDHPPASIQYDAQDRRVS